jgi:outer membrane protein
LRRAVLLFPLLLSLATAQQKKILTLPEAEEMAIRNHPRIRASLLSADVAREGIVQAKAPLRPFLTANVTGSLADHQSRISAGTINASGLFTRFAAGFGVTQTLYDFGRTSSLVKTAESRVAALSENAVAVRAEFKLEVRRAYYSALLAQSAVRVAEQTFNARRVVLKQISALAQSALRSTLDVGFAEVAASEAELMVTIAQSNRQTAMVDLLAATGETRNQDYDLQDAGPPERLTAEMEPLIQEALRRPDIEARRLNLRALRSFADSERRLIYPSIGGTAAAGYSPVHSDNLRSRYSGIALNLNIPILNGGINDSRRREAELRVQVAEQEVKDLEIRATSEVRKAWQSATDAYLRLAVAAKLQEQAQRTVRLAQTRYDLGLSNIVELTQSELSRTSAEIAGITARYEYYIRRATLDFVSGGLR